MNRNSTPAHAKHAAQVSTNKETFDDQETQLIPQQSSSMAAAAETQSPSSFDDFDLNSVNTQAAPMAESFVDREDQTQVLNPVQNVSASNAAPNISAPTQVMPTQVPNYQQDSYAQLSRNSYNQLPQMNPVDLSPKKSRRGKAGKVVAITLACIVALLAAVYLAGSFYFSNHFLPNTSAGSIDLSLMSDDEAEKAVDNSLSSYKVDISGQGFNLSLSAEDAGLTIDSAKVVQSMQGSFNQWQWPLEITKTHDLTNQMVATVNGTGLEDKVKAAVDAFNESARQPTNAYVSYNQDKKSFVINPETFGTAIDASKVLEETDKVLAKMDCKVKLDDEVLIQPTVMSDDPRLTAACDTANSYLIANFDIQMNEISVATLDSSVVAEWIVIDDNSEVSVDDGKLSDWVSNIASQCNTVGTERTYTRLNDDKVCTVSGGTYGWLIDSDGLKDSVRNAILSGQTEPLAVTVTQEGSGFTVLGGQDWGKRYIDVDLSQQYAYMFDDSGAVIWQSGIVSGLPTGNKSTPTGVYVINLKHTDETLHTLQDDGVTYKDTVVKYWMPFVGNSVGLHDAWWQPSSAFGNPTAYQTLGSHGCVNLPSDLAASLYSLCVAGDVVVVHW